MLNTKKCKHKGNNWSKRNSILYKIIASLANQLVTNIPEKKNKSLRLPRFTKNKNMMTKVQGESIIMNIENIYFLRIIIIYLILLIIRQTY